MFPLRNLILPAIFCAALLVPALGAAPEENGIPADTRPPQRRQAIPDRKKFGGPRERGGNAPRGSRFMKLKTALESSCYTAAEKQMIRDVSRKFVQKEFTAADGTVVKYNLFVPEIYDGSQSLPLVLFVHDAGQLSEDTKNALLQGTGAIAFASPEDQAKHPCFVLAPQYPSVTTDAACAQAVATLELIDALCDEYRIDRTRLYNTGQSMGGILALAINAAHPELFAASVLVACQNEGDAGTLANFADKPMWILVAEGDPKAFPGMQEACKIWRAAGAKIAEAQWDGSLDAEAFAEHADRLRAADANIRFVHFALGSVNSADFGGPAKEHMATWPVAYRIRGVRDWLFEQHQ